MQKMRLYNDALQNNNNNTNTNSAITSSIVECISLRSRVRFVPNVYVGPSTRIFLNYIHARNTCPGQWG